jgi:hypothetical protein
MKRFTQTRTVREANIAANERRFDTDHCRDERGPGAVMRIKPGIGVGLEQIEIGTRGVRQTPLSPLTAV